MLRISTADYQDIRRHGEETYPHESCGILTGHFEGEMRTVQSIVPCANAQVDSPQSRYNIDPHQLVRAQREARERGLDIIGFYHSHPDHPPEWSPTDLEEAHWVGCSYVITSVEKGQATTTNSFELRGATEENKHFAWEQLVVENRL